MSLNERFNIPALLASLEAMEERANADEHSRDADAIAAIDSGIEHYRDCLRNAGFEANGSDLSRVLEGVMYWFFMRSNPAYEHSKKPGYEYSEKGETPT